MIGGQSHDLELEGRSDVTLDEVLEMEAGKTAALLSCAASIGAIAAGAPAEVVAGLAAFGHEAGIAFQLVDDVLGRRRRSERHRQVGLVGRARGQAQRADRRRHACGARTPQTDWRRCSPARRPPATRTWPLATALIDEAGGVSWASAEADARFAQALAAAGPRSRLPDAAAVADLAAVADYIVNRDPMSAATTSPTPVPVATGPRAR